MADQGSELPGKGILHKQVSRRRFMLGTGKKLAVTGLAWWKADEILGGILKNPSQLAKPMIALADYLDKGDEVYHPQQVEMQLLQDPYEEVVSLMFPNTPVAEKQALLDDINTQREHMRLNVLSPQDYENLTAIDEKTGKSIDQEVWDVSNKAGVPYHALLGIVITESHGDRMAVAQQDVEAKKDNPDTEIHKGLTGMSESMARKYNLKVSDGDDDERFISSKILEATAEELLESFGQFNGQDGENKDWGIPTFEWVAGRGRVYLAFQKFLEDEGIVKYDVPQNVPPGESATAIATGLISDYQRVIREQKINIFTLLKDQNIAQVFEDLDWASIKPYVSRVAGSAILWSQLKILKEKLNQEPKS